jgi:hypothetical protein
MLPMVPFFSIEILMGLASAASASAGREVASDESEDGGQTQGAVHQSKTDERTWYHQPKGSHTDGGDAPIQLRQGATFI